MNKFITIVLLIAIVGLVPLYSQEDKASSGQEEMDFYKRALEDKEAKEVIRFYDLSSPQASFESYKKAIEKQDFPGIIIHEWLGCSQAKGCIWYGMSLADAAAKAKMYWSEHVSQIWADDVIADVRTFDFEKEMDRTHIAEGNAKGVTHCKVILERKNDGKRAYGFVYNIDGTKEWWFLIGHSGE
jgi:hypothetical protein